MSALKTISMNQSSLDSSIESEDEIGLDFLNKTVGRSRMKF